MDRPTPAATLHLYQWAYVRWTGSGTFGASTEGERLERGRGDLEETIQVDVAGSFEERVFFRNIPLSAWTEHELLIEDGSHGPMPESLPQPAFAGVAPMPAVFPAPMPHAEGRLAISKRVAEPPEPMRHPEAKLAKTVAMPMPARETREPRETRALVPVAAFGAQ